MIDHDEQNEFAAGGCIPIARSKMAVSSSSVRRLLSRWTRPNVHICSAHVTGHHQQIMCVAVAILDLVVEGGFGFKTEPLEDANRPGAIRNHLGEQLLEANVLRKVDNCVSQGLTQTSAAKRWIGNDSDFAYVPRPSVTLSLENCGPDNALPVNGYDHAFAIKIEFVKPDFDLIAVDQVFFQKGAVLLGHALKKSPNFAAILGYQRAQGD